MKHLKILALASLLALPALASAQDGKDGWEVELKRIALDLTSTQVSNAEEYQGFPYARLSANDQTTSMVDFNFFAGLYMPHSLWSNTLKAQYGKTTVKPYDGSPNVTSKKADIILLTTDYAYTLWTVPNFLGGFAAGPFVNAEYETQFSADKGANRRQVARARAGAKLFKGKYIKSLYISGVYEHNFTYSPASDNFAWETGLAAEFPIREGVKASIDGYYRDYISYSEDLYTNLDYEAGINARLDVLVWNNFSVAPVVNYFIAQAKAFRATGQNLFLGISFSWGKMIKPANIE